MGAADCGICEDLGYRTCDKCGGVAFKRGMFQDLCEYCKPEAPTET